DGAGRQMSIADLRQEIVELRTGTRALRGADAVALLRQRSREVTAPVTPENPTPRRTRGVVPVTPAQYASTQISVAARLAVDRNGAVTSVEQDSCSAAGWPSAAASVCKAFYDAAAAAHRQWRYERPAQAPIQFY